MSSNNVELLVMGFTLHPLRMAASPIQMCPYICNSNYFLPLLLSFILFFFGLVFSSTKGRLFVPVLQLPLVRWSANERHDTCRSVRCCKLFVRMGLLALNFLVAREGGLGQTVGSAWLPWRRGFACYLWVA